MTRKFFGTDGIRGRANTHPMTADIALRVGQAAAKQFRRGDHRHQVVIAKDTRLSGYMLEPALVAGFVSMGMDVMLVGPMPTPAVAMLVRSLRADLGVMISASHNPYQDNGIKLFGPDGYKLSDDVELAIEAELTDGVGGLCDAEKLGRARRLDDAPGRYIEYAKNTFPRGRRLDGMKIVVDCANGAAYKTAPAVLWELGADVVPIGVSPDGTNINRGCGSTFPSTMCEAVVTHHADLGIALDGDADRLILADEQGQVVDGDQLMGLIARGWHREGMLKGGGVVTTVMSNLGLERMLEGLGLGMVRTQVGDRYVVNEMRESGYNVGGEQSGHIVLNDHSTTGDGLIAALQVLVELQTADRPASEVCNVFRTVPQLLRNVRISGGNPLLNTVVRKAIDDGKSRLGAGGRLVIRPSGTEPLIRVMAEGDDAALVADVVGGIADIIGQAGD
ncbi:MAG: phosphoglucosamine mutase [Rhodospirillales bacterium]